jgi:hypothetical protein
MYNMLLWNEDLTWWCRNPKALGGATNEFIVRRERWEPSTHAIRVAAKGNATSPGENNEGGEDGAAIEERKGERE